jgi:hypothetical protein
MITDTRLKEIASAPQSATPEEIASLAGEVSRWRPVHTFVFESLKAVFINAKESAERSFALDIIVEVARSCLRRMKQARREEHPADDSSAAAE